MKLTNEDLKRIIEEEAEGVMDEGFFSRIFGGEEKPKERSPEEEKRLKDKLAKIKSGEVPIKSDKEEEEDEIDKMTSKNKEMFDQLVPWDKMSKQQKIDYIKKYGARPKELKEHKFKLTNEDLRRIIKEETQAVLFKPGLLEHVKTRTPLHENIFRHGSDCYFNTIRQGRHFYKMGLYECINEEERDMLEHSDLGEFALYEGEMVPLDFPMLEEEVVEEAKKKKKKKNPPLNKPMKNSGGGKKWKVYVRSKSGGVKKVTYGDAKGGLKGNWNNAEARKSFAARHDCENKKEKTQAGYWACRAHKDFGTNVPGRFW